MASQQHPPSEAKFTPTYHTDTYTFISPMRLNLSGLSVLITGASRGIGAGIARSFAAAGASQIAITARSAPTETAAAVLSTAKFAAKPVPKVLSLAMDVTSAVSIANAVEEVEASFGRLDILINNAGYLEKVNPLATADVDEWWKTMTINLQGSFLVSRAFLPLLLKTENGRQTIFNTSSAGVFWKYPGASAYQISKLALMRLNEFLDLEYRDKGIVSISFHPGGVRTELAKAMPQETHFILRDKVELAGDTLAWLAAEKREWLSGRYISVNWDMKELEQQRDRIVKGDLLKWIIAI